MAFTNRTKEGPPTFHPLPPPQIEDVVAVTQEVTDRFCVYLAREGYIGDDIDTDRAELTPTERWYLAASKERDRFLEAKDGSVSPAMTGRSDRSGKYRDGETFSIHAGVEVPAGDEAGRERLCRYAARPAFASEAITETDDGKVRVKMRRVRASGATHVELEKVQFLRRIAWLIPPPKKHTVTYAGVLAPAARLRQDVVPLPEIDLALRPSVDDLIEVPNLERSSYIPWAKLLSHVWAIDPLKCACGGRLRLIALIEAPSVIRKVLDAVGLPTTKPVLSPARGPPECN